MPCWRHLHLLQGAHCGCHSLSDFEAGVHGCRRRLCASLKAICTCFGVPFAAAVVQPLATAAAATPLSAPQPVTHPVLEEVSLLVCSESVVASALSPLMCPKSVVRVCNEPSDVFRVCGVRPPLYSANSQPATCTTLKQVSLLRVHSPFTHAHMLGCCLCLPLWN